MGHYAIDCRAEEQVEETINLALDDTISGGILLMAQNEEPNTKGDGGVKDDGDSHEVVGLLEMRWYTADLAKSRYRRRENWTTG